MNEDTSLLANMAWFGNIWFGMVYNSLVSCSVIFYGFISLVMSRSYMVQFVFVHVSLVWCCSDTDGLVWYGSV